MNHSRRLPSPGVVLALVALVVALAGTATALPGKNSVDKNDIKKNAIKSKAIKNGQVKAADLAAGGVGSAAIADGGVAAVDLEADEPYHKVGASGEPALGTGVEGDCIWSSPGTGLPVPDTDPLAFYRNARGIVRLTGIASPAAGPGGDASCGGGAAETVEDQTVFVLPVGYRPANVQFAVAGGAPVMIAPDEGLVLGGESAPGGAVLTLGGGTPILLNNVTFRAAGAGNEAIESPRKQPAKFRSLKQLRKLVG